MAGSPGEASAREYVARFFTQAGLKVSVEPFGFRTFDWRGATLQAADQRLPILRLGFDPYNGEQARTIEGELVHVTPSADDSGSAYAGLDLAGKVVVTGTAARFYPLMVRRPLAIAYVSDEDAERLRRQSGQRVKIAVDGRVELLRSANVVATERRGAAAAEEIIVSAHLDSVDSPGANDNASGVAVMLELVRPLLNLKLPVKLRFVAFGAEEPGLAGARAYLKRNTKALRRCRLLFNLDSVGGKGPLYAEMADGIRDVPAKIGSQLPPDLTGTAFHDANDRWELLRPERARLFASNVPPWLQSAIREAAKQDGGDFRAGRQMGSDHLVFAQAGVVTTDIAIADGFAHSAKDSVENVHAPSLGRAGRFALSVIGAAAKRRPL